MGQPLKERQRDRILITEYCVISLGPATIADKTCRDKSKTRAYFIIFPHENKDLIAQVLSLPSPFTQCWLEGLPIMQASFPVVKATLIRGRGEYYQCMTFHGQSYDSIKKCLNSFATIAASFLTFLYLLQCSTKCGIGKKQRQISCSRIDEAGKFTVIADEFCRYLNKPSTEEPCNEDNPCARKLV